MGLFGPRGGKYAEAVRADAGVVYFDYHGMSRHAERLSPDDAVSFLLDYHRRLGDAVFQTPASLVKFTGDQVMCVVGVPEPVEDPRGLSLAIGMEMRQVFRETARTWKLMDLVPRVGIDYGSVVAGYFGHPKRFDLMVMGEPVRLAQQASSCAAEGQLLATSRAIETLLPRIEAKPFTALKGSAGGAEREIPVFEIVGWK